MDSRQIYQAAQHLGSTLTWEKDWVYFGVADEIDYDLVEDLIREFLHGDRINYVHRRTDSGSFEIIEVLSIIIGKLGKSDFELWNHSMNRAIRFNHLGVLLKGKKGAL